MYSINITQFIQLKIIFMCDLYVLFYFKYRWNVFQKKSNNISLDITEIEFHDLENISDHIHILIMLQFL